MQTKQSPYLQPPLSNSPKQVNILLSFVSLAEEWKGTSCCGRPEGRRVVTEGDKTGAAVVLQRQEAGAAADGQEEAGRRSLGGFHTAPRPEGGRGSEAVCCSQGPGQGLASRPGSGQGGSGPEVGRSVSPRSCASTTGHRVFGKAGAGPVWLERPRLHCPELASLRRTAKRLCGELPLCPEVETVAAGSRAVGGEKGEPRRL